MPAPEFAPGPRQLSAAVCDSLVVAADPGARRASLTYWQHSRPWVEPVVERVRRLPGRLGTLAAHLLDSPADPNRYRRLRRSLAEVAARHELGDLFQTAWQAALHARLGYHLGASYRVNGATSDRADLVGTEPPRQPSTEDGDCGVLVVVPFRDVDGGDRLHNLLACLRALGDQSLPRPCYRVTVVESDSRPRWRDAIEPYVDTYLHAASDRGFSKAWAVNCGVVNSPAGGELVCVLDADILTDPEFLARNVARFRRPGVGAVLPYRDALYLDGPASDRAVRLRCVVPGGRLRLPAVRGFLLRRPLGGCIWARTALFRQVGGFDERFEGWGGEDDDFAIRLGLWGALDRFADPLFHLDHPPAPAHAVDGVPTNGPEWPPRWPTHEPGRLDRYTKR
jgi:hypothetical protein